MKELTQAFVLHTRPYRETSQLVDFFTRKWGRLSAVARGTRGRNKKANLQPFSLFEIDVIGSGELKTLGSFEIRQSPVNLVGDNLFIGMYVNELLVRLLGRYDPMDRLFDSYHEIVTQLAHKDQFREEYLRLFEFHLLAELGYGIVFDHEISTGEAVLKHGNYSFRADGGFALLSGEAGVGERYRGEDLLRIANQDFTTASTRLMAKKIARSALTQLLGDKPLKSRELFAKREAGIQ